MDERRAKKIKALPSDVDSSASIPTAPDADLPAYNFTASAAGLAPIQVPDRPKVRGQTVLEKIQLARNRKIVFLESDYPRVLTFVLDPNRSEFYEETIGWWIQKTNLSENLKMIVHLKCECGAEGSVRFYKSGTYLYNKYELMSTEKGKFVFFGTRCSCGSCVSYCGIEIGEGGIKRGKASCVSYCGIEIGEGGIKRGKASCGSYCGIDIGEGGIKGGEAKVKGVSIQMGKTVPSTFNPATSILTSSYADHPAFNFTASDLAMFRDSYQYKLILLLEDKFPGEPHPNPKAVFHDSDYPIVVPLHERAGGRSGFHENTIGWWIQQKDLPEDDLKMVVHLECKCGAKGCVYWYTNEGFAYNQDELIAVLSRKFAYFGTRCSCASDLSWCGIMRSAVENKKKEESAKRKSVSIQTPKILPSACHPAFNFTATDLGLFQYFYFYNFVLLLEGKVDRSEYAKIVDPECFFCNIDFSGLPYPNPEAAFRDDDYPTVIDMCRPSYDRSEFNKKTNGWWIQREGLPRNDLKMIVHLECYCGARGYVRCYNDGGLSWSKDKISAVLSRKVAYFASSCMCGSHKTHCAIARDKSIDEFLAGG